MLDWLFNREDPLKEEIRRLEKRKREAEKLTYRLEAQMHVVEEPIIEPKRPKGHFRYVSEPREKMGGTWMGTSSLKIDHKRARNQVLWLSVGCVVLLVLIIRLLL